MSDTAILTEADVLAGQPSPRHLNVGVGPHPVPRPWWNIDFREAENPDEVADARDLPYEDDRWDRVYAGHVLEHLSPDDVVTALREMRRVSTGEMMIVGPDVERGAAMLARGEITREVFDTLGAHGHDEEGNIVPPHPGEAADHQWDSTMERVCEFAVEAGLFPERMRIVDVPIDWPVVSRVHWQFAVRIGRKA